MSAQHPRQNSCSAGQFHDDLVKNGSLPVSIIEWILLDDSSAIEAVLK